MSSLFKSVPSAMPLTPAPAIKTGRWFGVEDWDGTVMSDPRDTKPICSRIIGAYSGGTFSPRQARIITSIWSSPGSVISGWVAPSLRTAAAAVRINFWISTENPAASSAINLTSRLGRNGASSQLLSPVIWKSTMRSTRKSASSSAASIETLSLRRGV